jgi:tetratricopeptide (TPR) repeat protein
MPLTIIIKAFHSQKKQAINGDKQVAWIALALFHFKLKDYNKALEFCSQALHISQVSEDKKGQSNALFHLGNIYEELADYNKATEYCTAA